MKVTFWMILGAFVMGLMIMSGAHAQDVATHDPSLVFGMTGGELAAAFLAALGFGAIVVAATPTKKDDILFGRIEKFVLQFMNRSVEGGLHRGKRPGSERTRPAARPPEDL